MTNFILTPKDHHRAMRGQVTLLLANACFAPLHLPETAPVDGHCWSLPPCTVNEQYQEEQ